MPDKLSTYHAKRNFGLTPEPHGALVVPGERLRFVVQKHEARKLHYDFRLELDGTLKSWAVPKGPSLDPAEKRLAVHVEDHPLDYLDFEGDIPKHQYGAGHVDVWDIGYWEPLGDPAAGYRAGKLKFRLDGTKLQGGWTLVRTRLQASGNKEQWLLIKERDDQARAHDEYDVTAALPDSALAPLSTPDQPATTARRTAPTSTPPVNAETQGITAQSAPSATAADNDHAGTLDPATLSGARSAPLPALLKPQLATLVEEVPRNGDWMYEVKFDGYRLLAKIDHGTVTLLTRDGKDWTAKLPKQAQALAALGIDSGWLDGEIIVLDADGIPSFQALQNAFDENSTAAILFFLFDLPYLNGCDLREVPLQQRRALLQGLLEQHDDDAIREVLRFSAPIAQPPQQLLDSACKLNMEGIIGKLADSPYTGKRSADWIKLKCRKRQEFVIAGYTEPQGSRKFFGALLLGVYDDHGTLRYAGRVGTGFDRKTLHATYEKMQSVRQEKSPVARLPAGVGKKGTHWLQPELVAEVSFAEWTHDDLLRQAVFHGLRSDKPASQIRRETASAAASLPASANGRRSTTRRATSVPRSPTSRTASPGHVEIAGIRISHPDRVADPDSGLTKLDVARYYDAIADRILPFLRNRPVYLLRCPEGITGEQFFQKHSERLPIPGITPLDPALDPDHGPLMSIQSAHALAGAAQMGSIELHTCNATADRIDRPDCMVFDLDPDPALPWKKVAEAAQLTKVLLDELGLRSFLKTSGGKGLHIVVPLARRHSWEAVTAFSQAVAQHMARTLPRHFSAKMGAQNRVGKIFIDYLRNQRQASTVAPYSVRARPGLPVSVPLAWEKLATLDTGAAWNISSLPQRLAELDADPWQDYFDAAQTLNAAMKKKLER